MNPLLRSIPKVFDKAGLMVSVVNDPAQGKLKPSPAGAPEGNIKVGRLLPLGDSSLALLAGGNS